MFEMEGYRKEFCFLLFTICLLLCFLIFGDVVGFLKDIIYDNFMVGDFIIGKRYFFMCFIVGFTVLFMLC